METLSLLSYLLALPLLFIASVAVFGWRYRKTIAASMMRSATPETTAPPVNTPHPLAQPAAPLRIESIEAFPEHAIGPAARHALRDAAALTRAVRRSYLIAGGAFWAIVVALQVGAAMTRWPSRALPLVALFAAFPGLLVLTSIVARSWRHWAAAAGLAVALTVVIVGGVGWRVGDVDKAVSVALALAGLYSLPGFGVLLLIGRGLRSLLVGLAPIVVYIAAGVAAMSAIAATFSWSGDLSELARQPELRLPFPILLALGLAAVPVSVWVFFRLLRSRRKWVYAGVLATVAVAGTVVDEWLNPPFPLGPALAAVPVGVLQCFAVWLCFKGFALLEGAHRLPAQTLQLHLCWTYLAVYSHVVLTVQLAGAGVRESAAVTLLVAGFIAYLLLTHLLLRRLRSTLPSTAPKRLLLLRVFNATSRRERLLDVLDDSWRRVGRVDLIGGADLAMRTLSSLALESFLLRRVDTQFLKTLTDVDQRLGQLDSRPEGDLRFPVNEIYCYADVWQAAVLRLAPAADAILLDLRGFAQGNAGCEFELTRVIWHVRLPRILVLTDPTTDAGVLEKVARLAWATLPHDSPNAADAEPRLTVLSAGRRAGAEAIVPAVFRTAFEPLGLSSLARPLKPPASHSPA